MASKSYIDAMKARAVKAFVRENARTPSPTELVVLMQEQERLYPTIDLVGFTGSESYKPSYKEYSSASVENLARQAIFDDMNVLAARLDLLASNMETGFRGFTATGRRIGRLLDSVEARLDNLLLLNSSVDVFVYGIEEEFEQQDKVDFSNTTASVESGWVTIRRDGYSKVDLSSAQILTSVDSEIPTIGFRVSEEVDALKSEDGRFWDAVVTTNSRSGRVILTIEVVLPEATDLSDVRVSLNPVGGGGTTTATFMVSMDGLTYKVAGTPEQVMNLGSNHISIGEQGVRKVRLLLTKQSADDVTFTLSQYLYIFSLDSLTLFSDGYEAIDSSLYCGPYDVVDELGRDFNFTKAKVEYCGDVPTGTGISFFLSQDNTTWFPAGTDDNILSVVSFTASDKTGTYSLIDNTAAADQLIDTPPVGLMIDRMTEALINLYIPVAQVDKINSRTLAVLRNTSGSVDPYGVAGGWVFDPQTNQYSTVIRITGDRGQYLDLGSRSAKVNGQFLTGQIYLHPGFNTFSTQDSNWFDVADGILTADALRRSDPGYPYNHKLLVEGYPYPGSFSGEKVYPGVGEWFGIEMMKVSREAYVADPQNHTIYCIDELDGDLYFRVRVNKADATWVEEKISVDYYAQNSETNTIYVKALLSTNNPAISPRLDSFSIRFI